ncbi:hypothetical protein [Thiobacillus sp.]|uniref:hypothetical protein n=1 Tax=Thiobacillus sp. TaxID=924 RepID=UPI00286E6F2F|nr:hypothetical protein [Thiobacillus sp.]
MKSPAPTLLSTKVNPSTKEWLPVSLDTFLTELDALKHAAKDAGSLLLFRGQCRREWRLDSTFARSVKSLLFGIKPGEGYSERLRNSKDLNAVLSSLLLLKFGTLLEPSAELKSVEAQHGVDAWFELMKRYQQYPEEDAPSLPGTNFLDWSQSSDVGLFFANDGRDGQGALFVCDATATGKTLQTLPVIQVLHKIREQLMQGLANGSPLLFSPARQIANQRAKNQEAVYFAQLELRMDMLELWRMQEDKKGNDTIVVKLVLPACSETDLTRYLSKKGIDRTFIYPESRNA